MKTPLTILYEDDSLAVIDKPAGFIVDRNGLADRGVTIQDLADDHWPELKRSELARPGIVHRLDKETSGLLLIALNDQDQSKLSQLFKDRKITKKYTALVEGRIAEPIEIDLPIGRSTKNRKIMSVEASGKHAITRVTPIEEFDSGFTLVQVDLLTGRTHQIRVHLSHIGHPIAGDLAYGARRRLEGLARPFLHASALQFVHPSTAKQMSFSSELPANLKLLLRSLHESTKPL